LLAPCCFTAAISIVSTSADHLPAIMSGSKLLKYL
jgi:hypothetical protein